MNPELRSVGALKKSDAVERSAIDGRAAFVQAVKEILDLAAQGQGPNLFFCAHQFQDWPLGDPEVVEALTQWAKRAGARHCHFVAAHYDRWPAQHPRWQQWRQTWSHLVSCWQASKEDADQLPHVLLLSGQDRSLAVELTNTHYQTGWFTRSGPRLGLIRQECDVILQRSVPGMPASVLGL